tara:strand:+ start:217 stop:441 length:225 start_codon:yes stop_codon:yes gene_type:complete
LATLDKLKRILLPYTIPSPNVALNGGVILATLLRVFAAKVQILRNPIEGLVRCMCRFSEEAEGKFCHETTYHKP